MSIIVTQGKTWRGVDVTNRVAAFIASECREIVDDGDVPGDGEQYRAEIVSHLESLGCTDIQIETVGYNSDIQSDAFGTISHAVALVLPPSVDLETLKGKLYTNDTAKKTGFYCVTLEPPTGMKVAA